jgi:hypothetical protein
MACRLTPTSSASRPWDNPLDCLTCFSLQTILSELFLMNTSSHKEMLPSFQIGMLHMSF